jgi:uncharacterized protein (DUF1499 family)
MPSAPICRLLPIVMLVSLLAACGIGTAPEAERLALDPLTLERTGKPNDFLVCPEGMCQAAADRTGPVLPVTPADQLRLWEEVIIASPRARVLEIDETTLLIHAEQRSRIFRFVDTIAIHVLPAGDGGSTFAAYSRSELGYSDMGVNQARLEEWIARLEAAAGG